MNLLCLFGLHNWQMRLYANTGAYRDSDTWRKGPANHPLYIVRCKRCEERYP